MTFDSKNTELQDAAGRMVSRLNRVRMTLAEHQVDAILINWSSNIDYVTGAAGIHDEENPHVAIITETKAVLLTDSRYDEVATRETADTEWAVVRTIEPMEDELAKLVAGLNISTIAFEDTIGYGRYSKWRDKLANVTVVSATDWIERVRWVKDEAEKSQIAAAQRVTDAAFTHMLTYLRAGLTETEIALELEFTLRRLGADSLAFPSIVAAGPNGSLPHADPSDRKVGKGEFLTLDFGAQVNGYKSDMTRTVCIGKATEEMRTVYEAVRAAQEASIQALVNGVSGVDGDKAARDVIVAAGFGPNFGHGTGHGVGLDIHEGPNVGPRSKDTLVSGCVVTVEPGIYLPGKLGVRIEDLVYITDEGVINFTQSPKHLIELDV